MKLATLKKGGRNGTLVLVSDCLSYCVEVPDIAPTLQFAIDNWRVCGPKLNARYAQWEMTSVTRQKFDQRCCHSPLPRAYQWLDASAYVNHIELVRKARGAEMPPSFWLDPLMYQGGSDSFVAPNDPIVMASEDWGIDLEAEIAVMVDDVPMGVTPDKAIHHIKLLMLVNDVSLRNLIPEELAKGFGFLQSKPSSSFAPVAVTPESLGNAWRNGKLHLEVIARVNGEEIGRPNAGVDMTFDFPTLIAHAAKSRPLTAGTIIGSGTVSNIDRSTGSCCLAELRMLETLENGEPTTPFLKQSDRVEIEVLSEAQSVFGKIDQSVFIT